MLDGRMDGRMDEQCESNIRPFNFVAGGIKMASVLIITLFTEIW